MVTTTGEGGGREETKKTDREVENAFVGVGLNKSSLVSIGYFASTGI